MSRFVLNRRTVLKGILGGIAASVALPPLEAMLNSNGTAYADGTPLNTVFGIGYFGNGGLQNLYTPSTTGSNFQVPVLLQPFADQGIAKYLSVASNMYHSVKRGDAHFAQQGWAFSCGTGQTMDQTMAIRWKKNATLPFDGIHTKIVRHINGGGNIGQHAADNVNGCNQSMTSGPLGRPLAECDPKNMFKTLFGMTMPNNSAKVVAANAASATSVLDIVKGDATRLRARLGSNDQKRMDSFLSNVGDLQNRVNTPVAVCQFPDANSVPAYMEPKNEAEYPDENGHAIYDLITCALACGLTRTFEVQFSSAQSDGIYQEATGSTFPNGLDYYYHGIQHAGEGQDPREQKYIANDKKTGAVQQVVTQAMRHFAYLGKSMTKWPMGQGTLLDQALMWITSDYGNGIAHDGTGVPLMFLGTAGGKLKGNYHYAAPNGASTQNSARMGLTALRALGETDSQWGVNNDDGNGQVNNPITEFLT